MTVRWLVARTVSRSLIAGGLWSGDPLDVTSRAEGAYQDGREIYAYDYDRRAGVVREP